MVYGQSVILFCLSPTDKTTPLWLADAEGSQVKKRRILDRGTPSCRFHCIMLQCRLRAVYPEKLVDVHFAIFHMTLHFHFLTHVPFDLVGVADFCGVALLVDKNSVAALLFAIRVTRCNRFVVLDALGIAYPTHLFSGVALVLPVYQHRHDQDHGR